MAELSITGVVQVKFDRVDRTSQTTGNTFSTRDLVIRTDEQYPQDICIQFTQDKCDLLDVYQVGESVTVSFNLRGQLNGWTNPQGDVKYFNTIQAWRIQRNGAAPAAQPQQPQQPAMPPAANTPPPAKRYVHTGTQYTEAQLQQAGWNHDQMVSAGHGRWEQPAAAPAPAPGMPPAAPAPNYDDDLPF